MALQDHPNIKSTKKYMEATKEEQIAWLYQIIKKEVEKSDEGIDYDLVQECTDFLEELMADEIALTSEEIEQKTKRLETINSPVKQDALSHPQQNVSKPIVKKRQKSWLKAVAVFAATFTIFFATISVVAKTQGYGSAWDFVITNARKIVGLQPGEQINENGITIVKPTGTTSYESIEELLIAENLHILYPAKLPNDIKLIEISQIFENNEDYYLVFVFSNPIYNFKIYNSYKQNNSFENAELYSIGEVNFYIKQLEDNLYHATTQYNGNEYVLQCNNYNDLIFILENMKGF